MQCWLHHWKHVESIAFPQEQRDREHTAELERRVMEKLARADIIEAQRQSIEMEMQRTRKDIATQEAWLKVRSSPSMMLGLLSPYCTVPHRDARTISYRVNGSEQDCQNTN